jgi:hypothetical protein
MENVAADEPESALEIERTHDLPAEHGGLEIRSMGVDQIDHHVRDFLAVGIPGRIVRQHRGDMLAEQAGHMLARGCKTVIEGRRDEHFDDGSLRPSAGLGIKIGLIHVRKTGRHDDAGGVMIGGCAPRQRLEIR